VTASSSTVFPLAATTACRLRRLFDCRDWEEACDCGELAQDEPMLDIDCGRSRRSCVLLRLALLRLSLAREGDKQFTTDGFPLEPRWSLSSSLVMEEEARVRRTSWGLSGWALERHASA
jgi:hypothetical protein